MLIGYEAHKLMAHWANKLTGAYVNILTNNINMTYSTNPGSTSTGFSRWAFTLLHEGTHALHAHVSPSLSEWAPGIIRPARHDLYTITSPKIAWTEGFAAFLPVAYLADRGVLGAYGMVLRTLEGY